MLPDAAPLVPDCVRCFFDCAKRAFGGGCCGFGRFGICAFLGVPALLLLAASVPLQDHDKSRLQV